MFIPRKSHASKMDRNTSDEVDRLLLYKQNRKDVMSKIDATVLPQSIQSFASKYVENNIGNRPEFLWKWLDYCTFFLAFPPSSQGFKSDAHTAKSLLNMLNTVLDDIADVIQNGKLILYIKFQMFTKNNQIPRPDLTQNESNLADFCFTLWNHFVEAIQKLPNYNELEEVLYFDIMQMVNGKYWSYLTTRNPFSYNENEAWTYSPHSMNSLLHLGVDLMACSKNDFESLKPELGKLREIYWTAGVLGHISNSLATWRREIKEKDFSSILFAIAIKKTIVVKDELLSLPSEELAEKIENSNFEKIVIEEWILFRDELETKVSKLKTPSIVKDFVFKNEKFLELHLACQSKL